MTISAIYNSVIIDYIASILLAPSIFMVFGINIYTWKKGKPDALTFNKMVKSDLDEFFDKINSYYENRTNQGIKWATIDGHFWLEIHIKTNMKIPDHEFFSEDFKTVQRQNLDFILNLANVSSRGKAMLERDLNRMEEANLDDVHDGDNHSEDGDITIQEGGQRETTNPVEQMLPKVEEAGEALDQATTNHKLTE